jgi:branched-chain amino acid transport system permease protein
MKKRLDWNLACGIILFAIYMVVGLTATESITAVVSKIVILTLFALSFNLQFGYSGMASLGHSMFFGFGGYALVILMNKFNIPLIVAIFLSIVLCAAVSLLAGIICLKNNMNSFTFLSMGLALAIYTAVNKWVWAGGTVGITYSVAPQWMNHYRILFLFIAIISAICCALLYLLTKTPFVSMLKGVRENEERLIFLGVNTNRLRTLVFMISGTFAGIAGMLYAFRNGGCYTASLDVGLSFQAVVMCVIGGMSVFFGPMLGALLVTVIYNYISTVTIYYEGLLGIIILLVVYFLREGILAENGPLLKNIRKWSSGKNTDK